LLDWPRNLANWFEWLPDGPVLWVETLLRRREIQTGARAPDVSELMAEDRARVFQEFLVERTMLEALQYFVKAAVMSASRKRGTTHRPAGVSDHGSTSIHGRRGVRRFLAVGVPKAGTSAELPCQTTFSSAPSGSSAMTLIRWTSKG
jgi:hypothetical protein